MDRGKRDCLVKEEEEEEERKKKARWREMGEYIVGVNKGRFG